MKRKILLVLMLLMGFGVKAQFNNEWIDYSKTHYKFKLSTTGLYRISPAVLNAAGIGSTPVEQFRLYRHGVQVPIYTSIPSGVMGGSDYLEFFGEMNDGKPDTKLYRDPKLQPSDTWSLETDTASYFLTVNPAGPNLRLIDQANNVAGNSLPAEQFFIYTYKRSFRDLINPGFASDLRTAYVYSSSYDAGEGWSSRNISPASPLSENVNLQVYAGGPSSVLSVTASGNTFSERRLVVNINGSQVMNEVLNYFGADTRQANLPGGTLGRVGGDQIQIADVTGNGNDRMVVAAYSLTYPRKFDFGGLKQFEFQLGANPAGTYIEVSNFNVGSTAPILLDLTNNRRYVGNTAVAGLVRFALAPSFAPRRMVLLNAQSTEIRNVASLVTRNFIDYGAAANQGNYLMISNAKLFTGTGGNPVENYRAYRSSAAGGSYNAKIYDIEQLYDQFAFGIKEHPLSVKNFIAYAINKYAAKPKFVLLVGRGTIYSDVRMNEAAAASHDINLVPTFGTPGSDNLLASLNYTAIPEIPIGRIAAVNGDEVDIYLQKVKEHESLKVTAQQTIEDKAWMKTVVHAIGGSDPFIQSTIFGYMNTNKNIIQDTFYGGKVYSFSKNSSLAVEQLSSEELAKLFEDGIGLLTYFGHSSQNTLEFNIDDPNKYNNKGKYPLFMINGCLAGDIFIYDTLRKAGGGLSLSEKYMLTKDRGSIGFLASSHFGIVNYLNIYINSFYVNVATKEYGKTIGEVQKASLTRMLANTPSGDFYARMHAEQINLHGDPAVKLHQDPKPDYVIEEPLVRISPIPVSVADNSFDLEVKWMNIGKAVEDSMEVSVKRQLPSGTLIDLYKSKRKATFYRDSLIFKVPINPITDKGENKILVTLDGTNLIPEMSENNNTITKPFLVIEDEIRPVAPYNYAIVNKPAVTFYASTANPLAPAKNYIIEVDTTELFNSSFKKSQTLVSPGGLLQFSVPGLTLSDSTVYYWRTAQVPAPGTPFSWNSSSFVYLPNSTPGYNQSHYFQMKKNTFNKIILGDDRALRFTPRLKALSLKTGLYPTYIDDKLQVTVDDDIILTYGCRYSSLQIVVYDKVTLRPWTNSTQSNGLGKYGSWPPCVHNDFAFEFPYADPQFRKRAMDFLESIPAGYYISITNLGADFNNSFIKDWMTDTTSLGSQRSLYHTLKTMGFSSIDSFSKNIPFIFITKKGDLNFAPYQVVGSKAEDYLDIEIDVPVTENSGTIESPWFGPALKWNRFSWNGKDINPYSDRVVMEIHGRDLQGVESLIATVAPSTDTSLAFVDPKLFPFIKLRMINLDSVNGTPNQLRYWRINADLPPEGAIAPNLYFKAKDSVDVGEPLMLEVAFKNVSQSAFDSVAVQMTITDASNTPRTIVVPKQKPIKEGDSLTLRYSIDTKNLTGLNTVFVNFNPNYAQPEQYLFNNFLFKSFKVKGDEFDPTLDVTFDGVRILNRDIVSARPHIEIKLTDNNKFLLLDDTSLMKVKVKFPNDVIREYKFDQDTLKFTPTPNTNGTGENTATIDFNPAFLADGEYELIVSGTDKSGNAAGVLEYKVTFSIVNKPMISNLLNYPNPFTTSTAFVFTLTGNQLPQNMRIQILTITGKVVREITKEELGPIRIGRNITEFKWDGTDQYGQKLANGVYLYRVITNLNGKSMDRLELDGINNERYSDKSTDKYFKSGYGKMYLMR